MDERMIEGIEACRPGSDDFISVELNDVARQVKNDPRFRVAYERVQQWDVAISEAFQRVPAPPGLADRILERLQCNEPASDLSKQSGPLIPSRHEESTETALRVSRWSRLRLGLRRQDWTCRKGVAIFLSTLAATVLVALFVGKWLQPHAADSLEEMADNWQQELALSWKEMAQAPPAFEIPRAILASPTGWQAMRGYASVRTVAYRLINSKGDVATLYVARLVQVGLPANPPVTPQSTTGNRAISYWRNKGLIYVLVVPDERNYRSFVRLSTTPLA